jgi:DNA-binding transcriptional LysR family regulator
MAGSNGQSRLKQTSPTMQDIRDALTPENLAMLEVIAEEGSFAAAARKLGLVPSALTYRVRQIEDALDVLLFDRSARQATPTEAGAELLREGRRLLQDIDAVANRVRRVATGWEPQLTHVGRRRDLSAHHAGAGRGVLCHEPAHAPEAVRRHHERHARGADLGPGRPGHWRGRPGACDVAGLQQMPLGSLRFIYVVAPHHPLASMPEPIADAVLRGTGPIAVADSALRGGLTMGLLGGQDVFTVDSMQAKIQAQLRGLGGGFLPESMVRPYLEAGRLVERKVARPERLVSLHYAWGGPGLHGTGAGFAMVAGAAAKPHHTPGTAGKSPPFLIQNVQRRLRACRVVYKPYATSARKPLPCPKPPTHRPPPSAAKALPRHRATSPSSAQASQALPAHAPWCRPATRSGVRKKPRPAGAWPPATARSAALTTARSTSPCATRALQRACRPCPACASPGAPTPCACWTPRPRGGSGPAGRREARTGCGTPA